MKAFFASVLSIAVLVVSCRQDNSPDVSGISVSLSIERFEDDFFGMDTANLSSSLDTLYSRYPVFFIDFSQHILGLPPVRDVRDSGMQAMNAIRRFIHDYRPIYDSVKKVLPDLSKPHEQIVDGLKHVKFYFPEYDLPAKLITFIGPMDAYFEGSTGGYGDVITTEGLAVGLQLHLGAGFSMYHTEMGLALYPTYISRKFTPDYIPVNCMKNIVDDLFPRQNPDLSLIEQMIEKGKRLYLLDKLMPHADDTLKIGYTGPQLKGCYTNEGLIWNFFVKNGLVYNNDPSLIKNYIGDSPKTPEFGDDAPGNIGLFVGWQIVKKFAEQHPDISPTDLMNTDPKSLFEKSGYRPR